ncbi:hypothetical protein CPC08DRAFT_338174 [Agrocybe pediades]|nr:hypothetical protein CPC08DRAFT_338174 [Agrocybe pediades]
MNISFLISFSLPDLLLTAALTRKVVDDIFLSHRAHRLSCTCRMEVILINVLFAFGFVFELFQSFTSFSFWRLFIPFVPSFIMLTTISFPHRQAAFTLCDSNGRLWDVYSDSNMLPRHAIARGTVQRSLASSGRQ